MNFMNPELMQDPRRIMALHIGAQLLQNFRDPGGQFGRGIEQGAGAMEEARRYQNQQAQQQAAVATEAQRYEAETARQASIDAQRLDNQLFNQQITTNQDTRAQSSHDIGMRDRSQMDKITQAATALLGSQGFNTSVIPPDAAPGLAMETDPAYQGLVGSKAAIEDARSLDTYGKQQSIREASEKRMAEFRAQIQSNGPEGTESPDGVSPGGLASSIQSAYNKMVEGMALQKKVNTTDLSIVDQDTARREATRRVMQTIPRNAVPDSYLGAYDSAMLAGEENSETHFATADALEQKYSTTQAIQYLVEVGYKQEQAETMLGVRIPPPAPLHIDPSVLDLVR